MMDAAFSQNAPDYVVIYYKCCHKRLYLHTTQIDEMETTRKVQTGLRLSHTDRQAEAGSQEESQKFQRICRGCFRYYHYAKIAKA